MNVCIVLIQDIKHSLLISIVLMLAYEFSLTTMGLKNFIFYGPRTDLISANREGIFSTFGYLSISLLGITYGRLIYQILYVKSQSKDKTEQLKEQKDREIMLI